MTGVCALTAEDAPAMSALHGLGFDSPWPVSDMAEHTGRDIALGLGEPLSGFLIIRAVEDQAELLTITTDPARRREGLAAALLAEGERRAAKSGADILFLEVAEDNLAAIALYRARNYEAFGRRPAYYRRPGGRVAALTFRKRLTLDAAPGVV